MNKLHTEHNAGYPFDVAFLAFMQNAYNLFNHFGHLAGNKAIISGCEQVGNTISAGTVYINGELFPFEGGTKGDTVFIKEETTEATFQDGFLRPLETIRTIAFGRSTPEKTFNWADFKRVNNLQELYENKTDNTETKKLLERIEKLEKQKQAVPIGLVAIWGKPENEIPEGWEEYVPMRGVMPIGIDPEYKKDENDAEDYRLNVLKHRSGKRSHRLTIEEMPSHNHNIDKLPTQFKDTDRGVGHYSEFSLDDITSRTSSATGGDQPHNNMPPYRVVQFIKYVGFKSVAP